MLLFYFFNDTTTTEIYTLSLHDALPIWLGDQRAGRDHIERAAVGSRTGKLLHGRDEQRPRTIVDDDGGLEIDRKSTRLNSSHANISYAVFCLKKKKKQTERYDRNIRLD